MFVKITEIVTPKGTLTDLPVQSGIFFRDDHIDTFKRDDKIVVGMTFLVPIPVYDDEGNPMFYATPKNDSLAAYVEFIKRGGSTFYAGKPVEFNEPVDYVVERFDTVEEAKKLVDEMRKCSELGLEVFLIENYDRETGKYSISSWHHKRQPHDTDKDYNKLFEHNIGLFEPAPV